MGLADMVSQFQPGDLVGGNGLADNALDGVTGNGTGLENLTNAGSELNIDNNPTAVNGLAEASLDGQTVNGEGLAALVNASSDLNIDSNPLAVNALAEASPYDGLTQNGPGLASLINPGSDLNIDNDPTATTGIANLGFTTTGWDGSYGLGTGIQGLGASHSTFDIDGSPNDMSDGLATGG
tara:strand:+ start:117 stop:659 length:543 start_codon:yes stop_codon:yes gene_type:complete